MDFTLNKVLASTLMKLITELKNQQASWTRWLVPQRCFQCAIGPLPADQSLLCDACNEALARIKSACLTCGVELSQQSDSEYCGKCLNLPPAIDGCFIPFRYEGIVRELTLASKAKDQSRFAKQLANLLWQEIDDAGISFPPHIVPVPSSKARLAYRGYNHALELSKHIAKLSGAELLPIVRKKRHTQPQTSLNRKARLRSVRGSFEMIPAQNPRFPTSVTIVDDVYTTGATVNEIATSLKASGISYCFVLGFARTE